MARHRAGGQRKDQTSRRGLCVQNRLLTLVFSLSIINYLDSEYFNREFFRKESLTRLPRDTSAESLRKTETPARLPQAQAKASIQTNHTSTLHPPSSPPLLHRKPIHDFTKQSHPAQCRCNRHPQSPPKRMAQTRDNPREREDPPNASWKEGLKSPCRA